MEKIKVNENELIMRVAKEFVKRGYKVHWWKNTAYNMIYPNDFTSIMISKDGNRTASLTQGGGLGYVVGWCYVPSKENGTGCRHKDLLCDTKEIIEAIEFVLNHKPWVKRPDEKGTVAAHLKLYNFYSREPLKMEDFEDGDNIEA